VKPHTQTNLMDRGRTKLNEAPVIISKVLEPNEIPLWHDRCTRAGAILFLREVSMRTLVIGLLITIVYLATYLVSTMERVW
jgi:hypothetical protein